MISSSEKYALATMQVTILLHKVCQIALMLCSLEAEQPWRRKNLWALNLKVVSEFLSYKENEKSSLKIYMTEKVWLQKLKYFLYTSFPQFFFFFFFFFFLKDFGSQVGHETIRKNFALK